MSINIVPQNTTQVKNPNNDRTDILALADHCLEEHNRQWALFVATGDHQAFLQAMAAKQDREQLLGQLGMN